MSPPALERAHGLPDGRLRFEVQVETPQLVLGAYGTSPVAQLALAAPGRISGLHYGTYDYSAVARDRRRRTSRWSIRRPTSRRASCSSRWRAPASGSPTGRRTSCRSAIGALEAWRLHARLVRRSLERGFFQGWDLHPHQLPTRYLATYAFYREGYPEASARLRDVPRAVPPARCSTSRRRSARSPDSCCAACAAARSPPTEVAADTGIDERAPRRARPPEAGHDMSGCRAARGTDEEAT